MGDGSAIVWAAFITGFGGLLLGVYTTWATRKKGDAEANAITSSEWRKLYDEMCYRIEKLEAKLEKISNQLEVYKSYIQYLWMVVVKLTNQLEDAGMEPVIKPDRHFRGDDDVADIEWEWLDE